jgi:drug/metabolite transporter (DMT)-like permease
VHEALVPILYAIVTAACFGGQLVMTMRSFAYVDPQTSSMITIGTCVTIFWLLSPFLLKAEYFTNPGMWIFFANGFIHPVFSLYLAFEASKRMGSTVSATISAIAPLFATTGAVLVLQEHITLIFLMGTICTVAGIMILSWKRQSHINWALPVLVFPLGAAVIRGVNHNIGKFGLQLLPSPYFAGLVSFTVSFVGAIMIYRFRIGSLPTRLPLRSVMWSGLAGICIAMGVLSMYSALHY